MSYISKEAPATGCVFCSLQGEQDGHGNLVLFRGRSAFVVLNRFPYVSGHAMIIPYRHAGDPAELTPVEWADTQRLVRPTLKAIGLVYRPHGFNVGMNLGRAAGAGIEAHCHVHVVPRWNGDTNFVPVLSDTRVIPEALEVTYDRLRPWFEGLNEEEW